MTGKFYTGTVNAGDWRAWVHHGDDTRPLEVHVRHSPDGHSWGYGGSGPAQLALDLLWDALGYEPANGTYQEFKWWGPARWPAGESWTITAEEILAWHEGAT